MSNNTGPETHPEPSTASTTSMSDEELRARRMERYRRDYGRWGAPIVNFFGRLGNTISGVGVAINDTLVAALTSTLLLNARFWRLFPWGEKVEIVDGKAASREDPLLSAGVLDTFMLWGAMLTAMFLFECWTWSGTFGYALEGHPFQVALVSFVFAWAVVNVDRLILLADPYGRPEVLPAPSATEPPKQSTPRSLWAKVTNPVRAWLGLALLDLKGRVNNSPVKSWTDHLSRLAGSSSVRRMMLGRLAVLLVISLVNAVPLELRFLAPEIEDRIASKELTAQASIRATEEARVHTSANARRDQENARYTGELQSYNVERERQRVEMVRQHNAELARRRGAITSLEQQAIDETRNGGVDAHGNRRPPGPGTSFQAVRGHATEDRQDLERYETGLREQQEQFTAATTAQRGDLLARHSTNLEQIRLDEERAVNRIFSAAFLTEHQSEWKKPRGFLARFMTLLELEHESKYAKVIIWGSRAIITILGMLFLLFKMSAPREVLIYLSTAHQAKHGHEKARAQLRGRGISDFDAFARDPSVKAADAVWSGLAVQAAKRRNALEGAKCKLALERLPGSFSHTLTEINGQLRDLFVKEVLPSLLEQKEFADFLASQGIDHEAAKSFLTTFDTMVSGDNLWRITPEELTALGWKDPQPDREMLERKVEEYANLQMALLHRVSDWTFRLIDFGDKNTPSLEVITAGQQAYQALQGDLLEMARLEALFTKRATSIPPWGKDGDPRDKLMSLMVGNGPTKWLKANTTWKDLTETVEVGDDELVDGGDANNGSGEYPIPRRGKAPPPIPLAPAAQLNGAN